MRNMKTWKILFALMFGAIGLFIGILLYYAILTGKPVLITFIATILVADGYIIYKIIK